MLLRKLIDIESKPIFEYVRAHPHQTAAFFLRLLNRLAGLMHGRAELYGAVEWGFAFGAAQFGEGGFAEGGLQGDFHGGVV